MTIHLQSVCKIGQGKTCCRYLVTGINGFQCAKLTSLRLTLDARVEADTMTAQGDNCDGYHTTESIQILNEEVS